MEWSDGLLASAVRTFAKHSIKKPKKKEANTDAISEIQDCYTVSSKVILIGRITLESNMTCNLSQLQDFELCQRFSTFLDQCTLASGYGAVYPWCLDMELGGARGHHMWASPTYGQVGGACVAAQDGAWWCSILTQLRIPAGAFSSPPGGMRTPGWQPLSYAESYPWSSLPHSLLSSQLSFSILTSFKKKS